MAIPQTKRQLIQRLKQHTANGFPDSDFSISDNEMLLYIDTGIPFILKGQMFENAKVFNVFEVPEAYLVTYLISPLTEYSPTNEWMGTLPQTPIALPTGYNITDAYISQTGLGRGQSIYFTKTKRVPYRDNMPKPSGVFARINGATIYLKSYNGVSLLNQQLYVEMPVTRTTNLDAPMNLPDDAIQPLFDYVVRQIAQRYQEPKDIIQDNIGAGNKAS